VASNASGEVACLCLGLTAVWKSWAPGREWRTVQVSGKLFVSPDSAATLSLSAKTAGTPVRPDGRIENSGAERTQRFINTSSRFFESPDSVPAQFFAPKITAPAG